MKGMIRNALGLSLCVGVFLAAIQCNAVSGPGGGAGTGSLKILVTDKPYPFDLIESATVTITRVDVHRVDGLPGCSADADCLDDVHCNGLEACVDGECVNGVFPCAAGEFCDEELEECLFPCTSDSQCGDPFFCNGDETCDTGSGECQEGVNPCAEGDTCDESLDVCLAPTTLDVDDNNGEAWLTIFSGERLFNLLDLQNGRTDLLADATIPAGTYNQMRLIVTGGSIKLFDVEEPFDLKVPSGEQTGIKLHFTFEVGDGEETTLLLDIDISRAFRPIPGGKIDDPSTIRTFHFTPSVAMRLINLANTGGLSGRVVDENGDPLENVSVTIFDSDNAEVTGTGSDVNGEYAQIGLSPDTYRLDFSLIGYNEAEVGDISVSANATTTVADVVMTAE